MTTQDVLAHKIRPALVAAAFSILGVATVVAVSGAAPWWILPIGSLGPDLSLLAALG